jgi:hypothetical protein
MAETCAATSLGPFTPFLRHETHYQADTEPSNYNGDCAYSNGFTVLAEAP